MKIIFACCKLFLRGAKIEGFQKILKIISGNLQFCQNFSHKINTLQTMDNKLNQRLAAFCHHEGISIAEFCRKSNISQGYFNKVKGNFGIKISGGIRKGFPKLNITWLSTGEGEMLLQNDSAEAPTPLNIPKSYELGRDDEIVALRGEVEYLKGQILVKDEEISFYRRTLTTALNGTTKGE